MFFIILLISWISISVFYFLDHFGRETFNKYEKIVFLPGYLIYKFFK
jgi:hypothetical protein